MLYGTFYLWQMILASFIRCNLMSLDHIGAKSQLEGKSSVQVGCRCGPVLKVVWGFVLWGNFSREPSRGKGKSQIALRGECSVPSSFSLGGCCDLVALFADLKGWVTSQSCSCTGNGNGKWLAQLSLKPEGTVCRQRALVWCLGAWETIKFYLSLDSNCIQLINFCLFSWQCHKESVGEGVVPETFKLLCTVVSKFSPRQIQRAEW